MNCRFCKTPLKHIFIDLFHSPASNSFLTAAQLNEPEISFPLKVYTCHQCFLVQVDEYKKSDAIFDNNYVYFSSYSTSWLAHAKAYTEQMVQRFSLDHLSQVIEIASNDGYLLQYFNEQNIPVLGIEPTANTAAVATSKGIETIVDFFGVTLAQSLSERGIRAKLLLGNNVLAHVPDILDFVKGMKIILAEDGIITMEFPHLLQLIEQNQFDTIYHEHFSYLSFYTVKQIFESVDLEIFDVDEIPTHGGSLRIYAKHFTNTSLSVSSAVSTLIFKEKAKGLTNVNSYNGFQQKALGIKTSMLQFLLQEKEAGKKIAAYGAAAKGNTLLNYSGVKADLVDYVVDANPHKQNKFLPGSHIPVVNELFLRENRPDFVIILPWNLKQEIIAQLHYIREWGGQFVVFIPIINIL